MAIAAVLLYPSISVMENVEKRPGMDWTFSVP
jgi:hypothetical protein